jgi:hypothetical protein
LRSLPELKLCLEKHDDIEADIFPQWSESVIRHSSHLCQQTNNNKSSANIDDSSNEIRAGANKQKPNIWPNVII